MWIVDVKGTAGATFEISVVRESNTHGRRSYGWNGKDKVIIASNGGPCRHVVPSWLFAMQVDLAERIAAKLNEQPNLERTLANPADLTLVADHG